MCLYTVYKNVIITWLLAVDEMIAEVDIDGDGRIDFEGDCTFLARNNDTIYDDNFMSPR